jgi:glycosyltransferase involved in cell wall biosynthesis
VSPDPRAGPGGPAEGGFCLFGEGIARVLEGRTVSGGAELQASLLARTLARHGVPVTIVDPLAAAPCEPVPGVHIEPVAGWSRGPKGLRFFVRRIPGSLRALRDTHASVFYVRGVSFLHLLPLRAARQTGAKFALALAHDSDVMGFAERYRTAFQGRATPWIWISTIIPNEIAHRLILRSADAVIAQHRGQLARARDQGGKAILLNNILDEDLLDFPAAASRGRSVVLVGAISRRKGLRALLPVIERLRERKFEFIGEATDKEGGEVVSMLREYPNAVLHGQLDRRGTLEKIASAHALLNVSPIEGFPNTFLEAWALRTPVISLRSRPGADTAIRDPQPLGGGGVAGLEFPRIDEREMSSPARKRQWRVRRG